MKAGSERTRGIPPHAATLTVLIAVRSLPRLVRAGRTPLLSACSRLSCSACVTCSSCEPTGSSSSPGEGICSTAAREKSPHSAIRRPSESKCHQGRIKEAPRGTFGGHLKSQEVAPLGGGYGGLFCKLVELVDEDVLHLTDESDQWQ